MPKNEKPRPAADSDKQKILAKLRELYSARVVEHRLNPRNMRPVPQADGHAQVASGHGKTVEFFLLLDGLPAGNTHCSALVARAFRSAVAGARDTAAEPCKKLHRRYRGNF